MVETFDYACLASLAAVVLNIEFASPHSPPSDEGTVCIVTPLPSCSVRRTVLRLHKSSTGNRVYSIYVWWLLAGGSTNKSGIFGFRRIRTLTKTPGRRKCPTRRIDARRCPTAPSVIYNVSRQLATCPRPTPRRWRGHLAARAHELCVL